MKERRSCSRVKPWIFFLMEITLFVMIGAILMVLVGNKYGFPVALSIVAFLIYKTQTFQRLERVLERTDEVRKVKVKERYNLEE